MLFMMAWLVSSHFNCFWRGWILFIQSKGVGLVEKFQTAAFPQPFPHGPYCGLMTRAFSKWRRLSCFELYELYRIAWSIFFLLDAITTNPQTQGIGPLFAFRMKNNMKNFPQTYRNLR